MPRQVVLAGEIQTPEDIASLKYQRVLSRRTSSADGVLLAYQQSLFPSERRSVRWFHPPAFSLVAQWPETGIRDPQTMRRPGLWMEQLCLNLMLMRSGREAMLNSNPGLPSSSPLSLRRAEPAGDTESPGVRRREGCSSAGRKGSESFAYLNSSFCSGITVAALICKLESV